MSISIFGRMRLRVQMLAEKFRCRLPLSPFCTILRCGVTQVASYVVALLASRCTFRYYGGGFLRFHVVRIPLHEFLRQMATVTHNCQVPHAPCRC